MYVKFCGMHKLISSCLYGFCWDFIRFPKRETCFASEMQFLGIRCSFQNNKYLVKVTVSEKVALGTLTAYVK